MVMGVVDENVVHAGVSGDATGRVVEDEEEGATVKAVNVGMSASGWCLCERLWDDVPFLQEDEARDERVAEVDPVDREDEEAEDEDEDNKTAIIQQYFTHRCAYLDLSNVVVFCKRVCILNVDSWVVIVWAYFCWRDGGSFVFAS
ncbi:hypothetical protein NDU88_003821 [Pleurodeles waltl]|uniref:Uncharacterized protein n=1 Tax=Pleurodeles waltl TaxID=8319 RepID=A0AAV7TQ26_PLEWA|nr:hypothetical protein NDU88_003821 [Pleurodeles waltl]